jgi:uncharacterized membrane protein YgcG
VKHFLFVFACVAAVCSVSCGGLVASNGDPGAVSAILVTPKKTDYYLSGDCTFDRKTDLAITATGTDGSVYQVPTAAAAITVAGTAVNSNTLSLSDLSEGNKSVSVAYGGKSDSYTINIIGSGNSGGGGGGGGSGGGGSGGGGIDITIHWPWDP